MAQFYIPAALSDSCNVYFINFVSISFIVNYANLFFVYMNWHNKFSAYVIDEVTKPKQQLNFIVVLSKHFGLIFQFEIIT